MRAIIVSNLVLIGVVAVGALAATRAPGASPVAVSPGGAAASRAVEFKYSVRLGEIPKGAARLRVWLPVPTSDAHQEISALDIKSPIPYTVHDEAEYHDRAAYLEVDPRKQNGPVEIEMSFKAVRHEDRVQLGDGARGTVASGGTATQAGAVPRPDDLARSLASDRLVPLDGPIAELAGKETQGIDRPLAKARAIYDYVLSTMRYDKTGEGWGRGDAIYACNVKKGNCTDFHALFIGMMRSAGIPARFEIGFPLPRDRKSGEIAGYHCWARFWVDDLGWVPVDASEAWKDPSRRDYFFGAHDANRILFTRGRDIRLDPGQQGEPLNYFVYPYAELDGKPWNSIQTHFAFDDLAPSAPSPASM